MLENLAPLQMKTSLEVTCVGPSFEHENENIKRIKIKDLRTLLT